MRAQNLYQQVGAKSLCVLDANEDVVILRPDIVESGLVFDDVLDAGNVLRGPESGHREGPGCTPRRLVESMQHGAFIEAPTDDMRLLPGTQFELPGTLGARERRGFGCRNRS
jgi:hypothetical protein